MIHYDTETVGFTGPAVLIQYAEDDGPIKLFSPWYHRVHETLDLIEWIMDNEVCGFNLSFDHFQLSKLYTMFSLHEDKLDYPIDYIDDFAIHEEAARHLDICLKPKAALDLMLHARKGPYQSLMNRDPIRIKRVPRILAGRLAKELDQRVELDEIYFARKKNKATPRWQVFPDKKDPEEFCDIVMRFAPKGDLKTLAAHALKVEVTRFADIEFRTPDLVEYEFAPYALAVGKPGRWKNAWPDYIKLHADHWKYNSDARQYAMDDVQWTRGLYHHFDEPPAGDDESELACHIASTRWRGYSLDLDQVEECKRIAKKRITQCPYNAPKKALEWLHAAMPEEERELVTDTGNVTLSEIISWKGHPAASRAHELQESRRAAKEIYLYEMLLKAKRAHFDFKITGARSGRMSGGSSENPTTKTGSINPQGIKRADYVRACFTFADRGEMLCGGDFDAFEVSILAAKYPDTKLNDALHSGKKIHALFALKLWPDLTYDGIMATKGTEDDRYTYGKNTVFSQAYDGTAQTIVKKIPGATIEQAETASKAWRTDYPEMAAGVAKEKARFCSMVQPNGIGTRVVWNDPPDHAESLLGLKRYNFLENKITKVLFDLANKMPKEWQAIKIKIVRRDREQWVSGATCSAIYAAAFSLQASVMRAALNHFIQSTGAGIMKQTQRAVADLQPTGINPFKVRSSNIHDELLCVCKPEMYTKVDSIIKKTVESFRELIPLIKFDLKEMNSWASK